MKENIKDLWVEALKSGQYKQTTNYLKTNEGYCCLGVLCEIYAKTQKKKGFQKTDTNYAIGPDSVFYMIDSTDKHFEGTPVLQYELPPTQVIKWAGLNSADVFFQNKHGVYLSLATLNDSEKLSFKKIAKKINKYWKDI